MACFFFFLFAFFFFVVVWQWGAEGCVLRGWLWCRRVGSEEVILFIFSLVFRFSFSVLLVFRLSREEGGLFTTFL